MKLILLNNAKRVLGIVHISEGGLDSTSADIRIIMQAITLLMLINFIICVSIIQNALPSNKITSMVLKIFGVNLSEYFENTMESPEKIFHYS